MGVKHFCIGWDVRILYKWWQANGAGMRGMLGGTSPASPEKKPASTY
jgi:4-hydroxy-2-oxoheptanedioate aldolase